MSRRPYIPRDRGVTVRACEPVAGFYLTRLVRGGPLVTCRVWYGPPLDPATGEEMDRAPRWQMELDGCITNRDGEPWNEDQVVDAFIFAAKRPISEAEYRYRRALADYARQHEPALPQASPTNPIDHMETPTPW